MCVAFHLNTGFITIRYCVACIIPHFFFGSYLTMYMDKTNSNPRERKGSKADSRNIHLPTRLFADSSEIKVELPHTHGCHYDHTASCMNLSEEASIIRLS